MTFLGTVTPRGDPASRICYPRFGYLQSGKIGEAVRIHHLGPARGGEGVDRNAGSFCLAEVRMIEALESGVPQTPFLKFGDTVRIEMLDAADATFFGAIEQKVVQTGNRSVRARQFMSAIHR